MRRRWQGHAFSRLPQFDGPEVAIFMDRMPVFVSFAFFEVHRFFTDRADWCVRPGASGTRTVLGLPYFSLWSEHYCTRRKSESTATGRAFVFR